MDFVDAVGNLTDRKASLKRESFKAVISALQGTFSPELLESHVDTIIASCLSIIKKNRSSSEEVLQSLELLGLLAITLGPEGSRLLQESYVEVKALFCPAHPNKVRCAALETRSLLEFICTFDHVDTLSSLEELASVFNNVDEVPEVKETALDAFSLLASLLDPKCLATDVATLFMEDICNLLHEDSQGVQLSAGTALALISEARVEHVEPEADDLYNVVANVSTRVEELSHENTKFLSKKAKAKIRSNFRDIFLTIDAGETHPEVINFGREKLVCDTWPSIVHLQRLRNVLSTGLNSHLKHNSLLRQIFEHEITDKGEKLVGRDKRLLQSRNSIVEKQRSVQSHFERGVLREESLFEEAPPAM